MIVHVETISGKAGKRFAFVRFINVLNLDRLIENLKRIGRFHLSANPARFERPKASTFQKEKPVPSGNVTGFKQTIIQNQGGLKESYSSILKPSLVLDDSCVVNKDLTNCVMGEVLQFSSINNLHVLLSNEGFHNTRVVYLGGLWVMIELKSSKSKSKFMEHVGSLLRSLKVLDPKVVSDYRPISLIGSLYKVVTKILASRLSLVISDLISDVQTAFLPNIQILDGPFIINEILARCKLKKQQAMIFKVDFAKAYDSVRWDYLDDVLISFGFGPKWRSWIRGSLSSGKASILVNGSPTTEFHLYRGLKQGDLLAPFLFLLIIESLHLSFSRAVEAGIFKGYKIDPSTTLSHLFYADDAVFIGEWSHSNLKGIMNILRCFSLLSGMSINIQKSHLLGVGIPDNCVAEAAKSIGCLIMKAPFKYLGILVGDNMSSKKAWDETINKMKKRLSRWKLNTLSVGGRLTLLKSVLGSTPIYNMSIFKVPKSVLNYMESLRRNFFNGFQEGDRKIAWVKWSKVLASKKFGGLGVSSFFALNRALLFKWVWRYLSHDNSLWSRIISALHGLNGHVLSAAFNSTWSSIITEVNSLKVKGVDLISHCKIRVGKGTGTSFWKDLWIGDNLLKLSFPRLFALEENKDISVADKMNTSISSSFRRHVRGGVESQQLDQLSLLLDTVILSNMDDRWFWDLNGDGVFQVKDVRSMLDEAFLPKMEVPTRWIKSIPIKVNVFAWKLYLDRLPTRSNLSRRNVSLPSLACPLCDHVLEDSSHLFFGCSVAKDIQKLICRWWNLDVHPY
ncbi:RNA-directed DNA polymerase, eukaryota [Tanacetum coccineum]